MAQQRPPLRSGPAVTRTVGQIAARTAVVLGAIVFALVWLMAPALQAAEPAEGTDAIRLIMVEAPGCRFCALWHAEIGPAYPTSAEGRFAPLVRVERNAPELTLLKPVTFTPTFIVMRGSREAGRLAGYPGKDYFWDEIREVLAPAGFAIEPAPGP
jgi:hypothetical protein